MTIDMETILYGLMAIVLFLQSRQITELKKETDKQYINVLHAAKKIADATADFTDKQRARNEAYSDVLKLVLIEIGNRDMLDKLIDLEVHVPDDVKEAIYEKGR